MPLVTGGLGQPESGAIVAGGLGASETNPNAMRATLAGTSGLTATLTNGSAPPTPPPEPTTGGGRNHYLPSTKSLRPRIEYAPTPAWATAHLSGTSRVTAHLDYVIDPDVLAAELVHLLLLDLV